MMLPTVAILNTVEGVQIQPSEQLLVKKEEEESSDEDKEGKVKLERRLFEDESEADPVFSEGSLARPVVPETSLSDSEQPMEGIGEIVAEEGESNAVGVETLFAEYVYVEYEDANGPLEFEGRELFTTDALRTYASYVQEFVKSFIVGDPNAYLEFQQQVRNSQTTLDAVVHMIDSGCIADSRDMLSSIAESQITPGMTGPNTPNVVREIMLHMMALVLEIALRDLPTASMTAETVHSINRILDTPLIIHLLRL